MTGRIPTLMLFGLLLTSSVGTPASASEVDAEPVDRGAVWARLGSYERRAIRDYEYHKFNDAIRERGNVLYRIGRSGSLRVPSCSEAALTLSYMVNGYYDARIRSEIAIDWLHFAKHYVDQRSTCLADLDIDARRFPLPDWLGR